MSNYNYSDFTSGYDFGSYVSYDASSSYSNTSDGSYSNTSNNNYSGYGSYSGPELPGTGTNTGPGSGFTFSSGIWACRSS